MGAGTLSGLRVIDISTVVAGGIASSMMGDHGAEVLKIEDPRAGDAARTLAPHKDGLSLWHKVAGRNKKSLSLNLGKPEGAEILRDLIKCTDILIENFRPGTLERWGLGWDVLSKINPRLVMVRISGFGQDGPYAGRPGFGTVAEAMAGIPSRTGFPGGPPLLSSMPLADNVTGLFAVFSAMFAIYERDHGSGLGQVVDLGLYESLFRIIEDQVIGFDQLGLIPKRMGNRMPGTAPRGAFQSSDEAWIAIATSSDKSAHRLLTCIGGPALAEDPRFVLNADRVSNAAAIEAVIAAWVGARTQAEALEIFEREDVVATALLSIDQIFNDPHIRHRENIVTVNDDALGHVRVQGVVPKFSHTPGQVMHLSVALGHHNHEVYGGLLGMTTDKLDALKQQGVI